MDERLKKIANNCGYESQSRQLIEEMAELTVAINKHWRSEKGIFPAYNRGKTMGNVVEEIADVEICLDQLKHLLYCGSEVEKVKETKIKRQLVRMGIEN